MDDVLDALGASGLDPALLILEVTESTLMSDIDATASRLRCVKAAGVQLSIDDFGTGFCSLSYVDKLPIDILKIDRSFLTDSARRRGPSPSSARSCSWARRSGVEILAEGIETEVQRALLTRELVETGQGFLFARPLEPAAVEQPSPRCSHFAAEVEPVGA